MRSDAFQEKPTLVGERVQLRPFRADDAGTMARLLADPELLRLTGSVHTTAEIAGQTGEPDDTLRTWYSSRNDHADRLDLAIIDRAGEQLVGEVVLNEFEPENDSCNIRILVGPKGRNRGLGGEAMQLMVDHAFTATELYRIELGVLSFNPRALHVYEKVGFVTEGVRRAAFTFDGRRIDDIVMSILRPDWETRPSRQPLLAGDSDGS